MAKDTRSERGYRIEIEIEGGTLDVVVAHEGRYPNGPYGKIEIPGAAIDGDRPPWHYPLPRDPAAGGSAKWELWAPGLGAARRPNAFAPRLRGLRRDPEPGVVVAKLVDELIDRVEARLREHEERERRAREALGRS